MGNYRTIKTPILLEKFLESQWRIGVIDCDVQRLALKSGCVRQPKANATYLQCEEILELIHIKKDLIRIRLLVEKVISSLDAKSRIILHDRFVKGLSIKNTMSALGVSERTYFRLLEKAYLSFERRSGLTAEI